MAGDAGPKSWRVNIKPGNATGGGLVVLKSGNAAPIGDAITFTSNKLEDRRARLETSVRATFARTSDPIDLSFFETEDTFYMLTDRTLTGVEEVYIKQIMEVYNVEMNYTSKRFLPILVNTN